jgi:hypothetical protein
MDVTRWTRQFSRHALRRRNGTYFLWRFLANGTRTASALLTRRAHSETVAIERDLKSQGIVVGPSVQFLTTQGQKSIEEAGEQVLQASRSEDVHDVIAKRASGSGKKEFLVDLVSYPEGMSPCDPLLHVALDHKLLQVVSAYFGMWPCLYSVGAWLNYPTDAPLQLSQLWHRDPEDLKVIKVFIYLTDVYRECGPFTYIPRTHPFGSANAAAQKLEHKKRVADHVMARIFPTESWRICTGQAGTMILADTVGYHRGGKPMPGHQRILITFTYTSGTPINAPSLWIRGMPAWASGIQRSAIQPLLTMRSEKTTQAAD